VAYRQRHLVTTVETKVVEFVRGPRYANSTYNNVFDIARRHPTYSIDHKTVVTGISPLTERNRAVHYKIRVSNNCDDVSGKITFRTVRCASAY